MPRFVCFQKSRVEVTWPVTSSEGNLALWLSRRQTSRLECQCQQRCRKDVQQLVARNYKPKLRHIIAFRKKTMDCTNESFRFDGEEAVGIKNTWSSSCVRSTLTRTAFTDHIRLSVGFGIQFNPLLKPDAMPTIFVHKRQGKVPKRGASA